MKERWQWAGAGIGILIALFSFVLALITEIIRQPGATTLHVWFILAGIAVVAGLFAGSLIAAMLYWATHIPKT